MADEKDPSEFDPEKVLPAPEAIPWTKENITFYFEKLLPGVTRNHPSGGEFVDLLVEAAEAERSWQGAFEAFFQYIKHEGLEIEADQKAMLELSSRLFYWRFVRQTVHATGLGALENDILKFEIAKYYQRIEAPPLQPKRQPNMGAPLGRKKPQPVKPQPKAPVAPKPAPQVRPDGGRNVGRPVGKPLPK